MPNDTGSRATTVRDNVFTILAVQGIILQVVENLGIADDLSDEDILQIINQKLDVHYGEAKK